MEFTKVIKNYTDTYLYNKSINLDSILISSIMKSERIDTNGEKFKGIIYQIQRRTPSLSLINLIKHPSVVLYDAKPVQLPKQYKVFAARDIRYDKNKIKIFIDISKVIFDTNGVYNTNSIDILIAYLTSGLFNYLYYSDHIRIINNSSIQYNLTLAFSKLMLTVIDSLYKISLIDGRKEACLFLSSVYCLTNLFNNKKDDDNVKDIATRIANISSRQADLYIIQYKEEASKDISTFISELSRLLKLDKLNLDNFLSKWALLYGTGTILALEYLPALSTIVTDTYIGAYINNQKTIEKILGILIETYTKNLYTFGGGIMKNEKL